MASVFNTGVAPSFTKEQQKVRRTAWKPNSARMKMQVSGSAVTVYRSPKAQAEFEAKQAQVAMEKAARRMAAVEKAKATRAANAKAKTKKA